MSTSPARPEFFFVANHPCLDFVNTTPVLDGRPVDLLGSFADLARFLGEADLLESEEARSAAARWEGTRTGADLLARAREIRSTLAEMTASLAARRPVSRAAVDAVNALLA